MAESSSSTLFTVNSDHHQLNSLDTPYRIDTAPTIMEQRTVLFDSNHRNQSNNNATTKVCKCILILLLCIYIVDQLCLIFRGRWVIRHAVAGAIARFSERANQGTKNGSQVCIDIGLLSGAESNKVTQTQDVKHDARDIEVGGFIRIGYAKQVRFTKAAHVIEAETDGDSGSEDSWVDIGREED